MTTSLQVLALVVVAFALWIGRDALRAPNRLSGLSSLLAAGSLLLFAYAIGTSDLRSVGPLFPIAGALAVAGLAAKGVDLVQRIRRRG